jgi:hypothetical protein
VRKAKVAGAPLVGVRWRQVRLAVCSRGSWVGVPCWCVGMDFRVHPLVLTVVPHAELSERIGVLSEVH